jgi:hypothetical protein
MFPLRRLSIPRALLVAMAILLALAIFILVVHPSFNVSKATAADQMATLLLAIVLSFGTSLVCARVAFQSFRAAFSQPQPQPLPIVARNCVRRI